MSIGVSDAVASNYDLAFSISPAKNKPEAKKSTEDDEEYTLTLAPFTKAPKINFGTVKLNNLVERNLLIINPQEFQVKLNVSSTDLKINNMEIIIEPLANICFKIKWQPEKPDNYKYTILFEVTSCARFKFKVHAFGICVQPQEMPKIRKPLATLKPNNYKKENSAQFNNATKSEQASSKLEAKLSLTYDKANKENEPAVSDLRRQTSIISIPRMYKNNPNDPSFKQSNSTSVFSTLKKANNETKYFDEDENTAMHNNSLFELQIEKQEASLTPKLSDFLKPSSYSNLDSLLLSCEKMAEQFLSSTQKASTKPIGRTLDLSAVSSASATTVLNMSKTTLKSRFYF